MNAVLYVHGKDGSAAECEHYKPLFPACEVRGLDYQTFTPWETGQEIRAAIEELNRRYENITLIANSIGAFFSMHAGIGGLIQKAYFISPVVDMEKLIENMMAWANVTEAELEKQGVIRTAFGEDLSWEYLRYVRSHPIDWTVPTKILYGSDDALTTFETINDFAKKHNAPLTVMEHGEHWFHTEEQMRFLDDWIRKSEPNRDREFIMIETKRLRIYPAARKQMESIIAAETEEELKAAYAEMLEGCLRHPDRWEWYAMWMIELRDGTHIGDLCFKGLDTNGAAEIGYGISEEYRGQGYANEAVSAVCAWAFQNPAVTAIEAETDAGNTASQRVLEKSGFLANGKTGEEGPRFTLRRKR